MWLNLSRLDESDRCRLARKFRQNAYSPAPLTCEEKLAREAEERQLARWQRWGDLAMLALVGWLLWAVLG